ncbi:hypothetical protein ABZ297_03185 [Nonomuraea sp. NPDC005983]|uniref:hypothetical protein n=1 Tax=Nonomuraea sp. NPDC005983 TaxID=3155595 RepID=UPI0033A7AAD8
MDDDHRVWPPGPPKHRRTSPRAPEPPRSDRRDPRDLAPPRSDRRDPYVPAPPLGAPRAPGSRRGDRTPSQAPEPSRGDRRDPWDLTPSQSASRAAEPRHGRRPSTAWGRRDDPDDGEWPRDEPGEQGRWIPRIRAVGEKVPWESLPPSARLYGAPADPGLGRKVRGRRWRRWAGVGLALVVAGGLVAGLVVILTRPAAPEAVTVQVRDAVAGVTLSLPPGWREEAVPPVTGFTSVLRDGGGALVMARPVAGPVADARKAAREAAELYSRLLLKGDRVTVVDDRSLEHGYTRALRAEYRDVVNGPAYLRVTLLTRPGRDVLLVGLLQPDDGNRRQALDAVLSGVR